MLRGVEPRAGRVGVGIEEAVRLAVDTSPTDHLVTKAAAEEFVEHALPVMRQALPSSRQLHLIKVALDSAAMVSGPELAREYRNAIEVVRRLNPTCVCGAPLDSLECRRRAHLRGPEEKAT